MENFAVIISHNWLFYVIGIYLLYEDDLIMIDEFIHIKSNLHYVFFFENIFGSRILYFPLEMLRLSFYTFRTL